MGEAESRNIGTVAVEDVLDGGDLDAGESVIGVGFGGVKSGGDCLILHGFGRWLKGDEQGHVRLFAIHVALERRDDVAAHLPALDLDDDGLGLAGVVVEELM